MSEKSVMDYARAVWSCSCGREHRTGIRGIVLGENALQRLPELVANLKTSQDRLFDRQQEKLLLVADQNTWQAAGAKAEQLLKKEQINCRLLIFQEEALVPDEKAVFQVLAALDPQTTLMLAVGSGTINDLVRFVSCKAGRPYLCLTTAPSMDGYTSTVAPMIQNNLKITYEACSAAGLIAQPDILTSCPQAMLAAGLGDVLGKYTALVDWQLGHLVEKSYYCSEVASLVRRTAEQALAGSAQLARRGQEAVMQVMEALLLTGIAMSYVGNSQPASGAEHHLSHFLEMYLLHQGCPPVLHGTKVGLTTPLVCVLYHQLKQLRPDFTAARDKARCFSQEDWEAAIRTAYGRGAAEVIRLGRQSQKNQPQRTLQRIAQLQENWPQIIERIEAGVPDPCRIRQALISAGGPRTFAEAGLADEWVLQAVAYAPDMRDRYTVLQLYRDLGLQAEAAAATRRWLSEAN